MTKCEVNELRNNFPEWKTTAIDNLSDKRSIWDWLKYKIRKHAIYYSKQKARTRNARERLLQTTYEEAAKRYEEDPSTINQNLLNEAKEILEHFYEEKTRGIIIRARARWHEHGERISKYFLNLEKRNNVRKHIRKLCVSGVITTDPYQILEEQNRFYNSLYESQSNDINDKISETFLSNLKMPTLSEEQKQSCEGEISFEELESVLNSFQNNKLPGNDGLPIEFYKTCWNLINESFMECVQESFKYGEMSSSQRKAVITLIEKQGKDRPLIENWRPISLINVDAKIISKVIAVRVKNVLPDIIHHNQTGYVKDRYIGETVRSIFDIMEFTDTENIPGILIFIDFKKAFDTVEWHYLFDCLKAFNFGPDLINWVKTFYGNIESCVINNGLTSDYFTLAKGVRQGDPLSPYLFLLVIETLAISIRKNPEIEGIKMGNNETKVLQYADDTTAVLSNLDSANALFQHS